MRWKELFNYNYMMYGVLAGILTAIVPTMVIFEVSQQLGWSSELMKNWIFGAIVLAACGINPVVNNKATVERVFFDTDGGVCWFYRASIPNR